MNIHKAPQSEVPQSSRTSANRIGHRGHREQWRAVPESVTPGVTRRHRTATGSAGTVPSDVGTSTRDFTTEGGLEGHAKTDPTRTLPLFSLSVKNSSMKEGSGSVSSWSTGEGPMPSAASIITCAGRMGMGRRACVVSPYLFFLQVFFRGICKPCCFPLSGFRAFTHRPSPRPLRPPDAVWPCVTR